MVPLQVFIFVRTTILERANYQDSTSRYNFKEQHSEEQHMK
jgi:hypothetical protein